MSFHWYEKTGVRIDTFQNELMTYLKTYGGWLDVDPGYPVVSDPNSKFDVYIHLEPTNERYLQIEIGEHGVWNTSSHSMGTPKIESALVTANIAGAVGLEEGISRMAYDDYSATIITDFRENGANYRRGVIHFGLLNSLKSDDYCIFAGSTMFNDTQVSPNNSNTNDFQVTCLYDLAGNKTKPNYCVVFASIGEAGADSTNFAPDYQILSAWVDKRYLIPIYLCSHSNRPTGGENAGFRGSLRNIFTGGDRDTETYGQILKAVDAKEYFYFIQVDTINQTNFGAHLLIRKV